jgi:hypothetical protein
MENKLQNYCLYLNDIFPENYWLILNQDHEVISGLMFNKETLEMNCWFELDTKRHKPSDFTRIDNIYMQPKLFKLTLKEI